MHRETAVHEGSRFAQIMERQLCSARWRVERVYRDSQNIEHAHLVNLDDPTVRKTIAVSQLADERQFALIIDGAPKSRQIPHLYVG